MLKLECPTCHRVMQVQRLEDLRTFPFCSERCKMVDLGRWLQGDFRIPGEDLEPEDSEESAPPEESEKNP